MQTTNPTCSGLSEEAVAQLGASSQPSPTRPTKYLTEDSLLKHFHGTVLFVLMGKPTYQLFLIDTLTGLYLLIRAGVGWLTSPLHITLEVHAKAPGE